MKDDRHTKIIISSSKSESEGSTMATNYEGYGNDILKALCYGLAENIYEDGRDVDTTIDGIVKTVRECVTGIKFEREGM